MSRDAATTSDPSAGAGEGSGAAAALRVLIVDADGRLERRVRGALAGAGRAGVIITRVGGFLKAMGQVVRPPAAARRALDAPDVASPPDVLIGPIERLHGDVRASASALARLAPHTRLVLVAPRGVNGRVDAAKDAGFETVLVEPVTDEALRHAIVGGDGPDAAGGDEQDDIAAERELRPGADGYTAERELRPGGAESAAGIPFDDAVIEQMLNPHGAPLDAAVNVIRRQAGLGGVQFAESGAPASPCDAGRPPGASAAAEVSFGGESFGVLHAPSPVAASQLRPWADWLARWCAMHRQVRELWFMAMRDELTGAWNRRYFNRFLRHALARAGADGTAVTLMVFDIDDFKRYNDEYGHAAGDEILRETTRLMQAAVREHDVVARIGGDEFAVVFWDAEAPRRAGSRHPVDVRKITERFRRLIRNHKFPKLAQEAPGTLTISGGLAGFPVDGRTPDELLGQADAMARQSKRSGKNAITFGPGAVSNGA